MDRTYPYKFSVIMSIYNTSAFLEEAVDSLIKQTIGFENIELVFINDGSTDRSEEICQNYMAKYPNIKYFKKENGGLPSAKNYGLTRTNGELVSFFDSDDIMGDTVFEEVYKFMSEHHDMIDFCTLPPYFFDRETGLHPKYRYMGEKNRVIDLYDEPYNFVLMGTSSFYRAEKLEGFQFDETYVGEEDALLNFTLYNSNPRFGYVCENGAIYHYRRRSSGDSIVDKAFSKKGTYFTPLKLFKEVIPETDLQEFHKEILLYVLRSRLRHISKEMFTPEEYEELMTQYRHYIGLMGIDFISREEKLITSEAARKLFYDLAGCDFNAEENAAIRRHFIKRNKITIIGLYEKKGRLEIDIVFRKYGLKEMELLLYGKSGDTSPALYEKRFDGIYNLKFGNFKLDDSYLVHFSLKLKDRSIRFIFKDNLTGELHSIRNFAMNESLGLLSYFHEIRFGDYVVTEQEGRLHVTKKAIGSRYDYVSANFKRGKEAEPDAGFFPAERLLSKRSKDVILIYEGGEDLFRHIYKNVHELKKNTYYVLPKSSPDFKRLQKIGDVIEAGSYKHKDLFMNAKFICTVDTSEEAYSALPVENLTYYKDILEYRVIKLDGEMSVDEIVEEMK